MLTLTPNSKVVVLTGAGVSAESGIATFRDAGGLWEGHDVTAVASPQGFKASPETVWRFYGLRRAQALTVEPNPAHRALAALEERLGDDYLLVTQNVDDLHERAGSKRVIHMHGELFKTRCSDPRCGDPRCGVEPFEDRRHDFSAGLPRAACGALERPHIVWFGEVPFEMPTIEDRVYECDLFLTIGSSGVVYPAAALVELIALRRLRGDACRAVYVGLEHPANAHLFDEVVIGPAGEVLPRLFDNTPT